MPGVTIDRCHLVRDLRPSHAVSKDLVLGIETGGVKSIWRSDREDDLSECGEFEHARHNDGDLEAGAKLWTLDSGDRLSPCARAIGIVAAA